LVQIFKFKRSHAKLVAPCSLRSHRPTNPRKTTANAVHLLLPTHAQENVSELDRKKRKLKIMVEIDRKREWQATAANERFGKMAAVPRWICGEKQQVKWLVASAVEAATSPSRHPVIGKRATA